MLEKKKKFTTSCSTPVPGGFVRESGGLVSLRLCTPLHIINPRRACAARVTVLGLCVSVCVCYSTSHFTRDYSCHKRY